MVVTPYESSDWANSEDIEALGDQERAALNLAKTRGAPLYSDDQGMRDLAKEAGIAAFGTRSPA